MNIDLIFVGVLALLGLLVGSFSNVLIWRLPRGENVSFPPSHCPKCDHPLAPRDLVPVFSWLSLGGKCRYCRAPINPRYPTVEVISGIFYGLIALAFPVSDYSLLLPIGLGLMFTILFAGSVIDIETYTLPDALTMVGLLIALGLAATGSGLVTLSGAVFGALIGAGSLSLINQYGSWVMRRFRERQYPDFPIGYPQISLGALAGAWLGPIGALVAAGLSMAANLVLKKPLPLPEIVTLGGFLLSMALAGTLGADVVKVAVGGVQGMGAASLLAGFYWWLAPKTEPEKTETEADAAEDNTAKLPPHDPIAMGFGDVKLLAAIGAFLGWKAALISIGVAVVLGAVLGLAMRGTQGNKIPFGPYLAAGALLALFFGNQLWTLVFPTL